MSEPLAGIRVIDLTSAVLGPVATQILGDMGAEVLKIEPPPGDPARLLGPSRHPGMGAYFLNINRNKKSVVLDLKRPAARQALLRLAETADVFVHNMRLAAAERLGLNYAAVASRNPRIVYAAATGFRKDGVHRDRPSFDDVIQGESGLAALNSGPGGEPCYVPMAVCDKICGYVLASAIGWPLTATINCAQNSRMTICSKSAAAFLLSVVIATTNPVGTAPHLAARRASPSPIPTCFCRESTGINFSSTAMRSPTTYNTM